MASSSRKLMATAPEFIPQSYVQYETQLFDDTICFSELDYSRQDSCISNADSFVGDEALEEVSSDAENQRGHRSSSVVSDASEEGGRDSGIEAEKELDMVVPDQDLTDRIVTQVELYFSDANVSKDKFLLKHIRRNKEGYVSLKLVSSFKKVKQLTKDWRVVAHALKENSVGIQINDLGTKIRRTAPLPEIDETPVTCIILALNLPLEKPTIDSVSQLFAQCGDIALIRVLKVGSPMSAEIKQLCSKYPELTETNCAWIEFDAPEAVKEASKLSDEEGMKVIPIPPDSGKKNKNAGSKSQGNSRKNSAQSTSGSNSIKQASSRKNSVKFNNNRNNFEQHYFPNPNYNSFYRPNPQRRKAVSLNAMERPNLRDLNVVTNNSTKMRPKSKSCIAVVGGSYPMPVLAPNHLFTTAIAHALPHGMPHALPPMAPLRKPSDHGRLIREPKGPVDGAKGFVGFRRKAEASP